MKEFVPGVPLDPPMAFVVKSFNGNVTGAGAGALTLEEWVGLCPGESVSRGGLCPRGLCLGSEEGLCPEGISVPGFSVQGCLSRGRGCQGEPRTVTYGRYASYWNAFLF